MALRKSHLTAPIGAYYERKDDDWLGRPEYQYGHFNKNYAEAVGGSLTGKGLRHDSHHAGQQILGILAGGGLHSKELMHAYVHSKVPAETRPFRHDHHVDIAAMHNEQLSVTGGSVKSQNHPYILVV